MPSSLSGLAWRPPPRQNGLTAAELRHSLLEDRTLWLDRCGRRFYSESESFKGAPSSVSPAPPGAGAESLPFPADRTFLLHSRPGAGRVIYLDFDGETLAGTAWNANFGLPASYDVPPFDTDGSPSTFSTEEQAVVQDAWQRVAEDYAPFDIDVTTENPGVAAIDRSGIGDSVFGTKVVVTLDSGLRTACGCGGIAYVGAFDRPTDHQLYQPALVFNSGGKGIGEAASHEAGHTLGLSHDGTTAGAAYYGGHGGWAPIMGVGYYRPITQWSKGEYADANNAEDDLSVMQSHGATLRPDDVPDTRAAAVSLGAGSPLTRSGVIGTSADVDWFSFSGSGQTSVTALPAAAGPNLDIRVELYDSAGALLASSDPPASSLSADAATGLDASLPAAPLAAGTYFIRVDGVGFANAATDGYSDYASLGAYSLSVTTGADVPESSGLPQVSGEPTEGQALTTSNGSWSNSPSAFTYRWRRCDTAGAACQDIAATAQSYVLGQADVGSTIRAQVTASNGIGSATATSLQTAVIVAQQPSTAPGAPTAVGATAGNGSATVTFATPTTNGGSAILSYTVTASPGGASASGAGSPIVVAGLANGTTYTFTVTASNAVGPGPASTPSNAVTPVVAVAWRWRWRWCGGGGGGAADLWLTGSAEPVAAPVGGTITWRVRVLDDKNYRPATGVYVDVDLPSGVSLAAAQADRGPGCVATGERKLRCNLDWLSSDAPYGNVTLVTNVVAGGELVLTATVGYSAADPNPADNTLVLKAGTPSVPSTQPATIMRPILGKPAGRPVFPVAGKRFTLTVPVNQSTTGAPLTTGRVVATSSVSGLGIRGCRYVLRRWEGACDRRCAAMGPGQAPPAQGLDRLIRSGRDAQLLVPCALTPGAPERGSVATRNQAPAVAWAVCASSRALLGSRTTRTGQGARRTIALETLPRRSAATVPCPRVPTAISRALDLLRVGADRLGRIAGREARDDRDAGLLGLPDSRVERRLRVRPLRIENVASRTAVVG